MGWYMWRQADARRRRGSGVVLGVAVFVGIAMARNGMRAGECAPADASAVIGFINLEVPPGDRMLASMPFDGSCRGWAWTPALDAHTNSNSGAFRPPRIWVWDRTHDRFLPCVLEDQAPPVGSVFWVEHDNAMPGILRLFGSIPTTDVARVSLNPGLDFLGPPFPADLPLGDAGKPEDGNWLAHAGQGAFMDVALLKEPLLLMGEGYLHQTESQEPTLWRVARSYGGMPSTAFYPTLHGASPKGEVVLSLTGLSINLGPLAIFGCDLPFPTGVAKLAWSDMGNTIAPPGDPTFCAFLDDGRSALGHPARVRGRAYVVVPASGLSGRVGERPWPRAMTSDSPSPDSQTALGETSVKPDASASDAPFKALAPVPTFPVSTNGPTDARRSHVRSRTVYVAAMLGDDGFSGRFRARRGPDGPKRTLGAGLRSAQAGDSLVVADGAYSEPFALAGKGIQARIEGVVTLIGPPMGRPRPARSDAGMTNRSQRAEMSVEGVR